MQSRLIFFVLLASASFAQVKSGLSSRELVATDAGIQVWKLIIPPHSTTQPFVHTNNYVFVPLFDMEVMQSTRQTGNHNPLANVLRGNKGSSWVPRDSHLSFVHPQDNEPKDGEITYNFNDSEYFALEIEVNEALPALVLRASLFDTNDTPQRNWQIGSFLLNIQMLRPGDRIGSDASTREILFAASAVTLGLGPQGSKRTILAGEPVEMTPLSTYQNLASFQIRVLLIKKTTSEKLLVAKLVNQE